MRKILIVLIALISLIKLHADDGSAIYGIFLNTGIETNDEIESKTSINGFLSIFCASFEVKHVITEIRELNFSVGVGLGNIIQFQGGYGTNDYFIEINSDFPIGKFISNIAIQKVINISDNDYQNCREKWYKRINLNTNIQYYFNEKNFTYSFGLGYLIL